MVILLFIFIQINKEQAELARANFLILRKEAQSILDLVGLMFLVLCFGVRCVYLDILEETHNFLSLESKA